jgi:hypothetical protein
MAWFQEQLYVGISRLKSPNSRDRGVRFFPGSLDTVHPAHFSDQRAQIWRYNPKNGSWKKIFVSPMIKLEDGSEISRDVGYRKMVVFQGVSDPTPALYVSTLSAVGSLILRSEDGERFVPASMKGLGKPNIWSFRAIHAFNGRLYASPSGRIRGDRVERNAAEIPIVFENADPAVAPWRPVSTVGFGDPSNSTIFEMTSLNGYLYAGTFNPLKGFQVWKTRAQTSPYGWKRVVTDGAFRGDLNQAATSMCAFRGVLYVGTGKGIRSDSTLKGQSRAAELLRIYPDDGWDLIVGTPRHTFEGIKFPLSGLSPGFDDQHNEVIWEMIEHNGWLYAGTENLSPFLAFFRPFGRARGACAASNLWRSRDGMAWELVTRVGFGNTNNWAIESMTSTPDGLFVGTIGLPDFTRSTGVLREAGGFSGGCEVWLGW